MHTLGLSLHVVARLLGEKVVEEELVPVFEEMIQVCSTDYLMCQTLSRL